MKQKILTLIILSCLFYIPLTANVNLYMLAINERNVQEAVEEIEKDLLESVKINQHHCDILRQRMDLLMNYLGYDPLMIVGKNGKYYQEGMHQHFKEEPKPMSASVMRNPMTVQLEATHIDLYHCDKELFIQIERFKLLKNYLTTQDLETILINLNEKYDGLSSKKRPKTKRKKREWIQSMLLQWSKTPPNPVTPQELSNKKLIATHLRKDKLRNIEQELFPIDRVENSNPLTYNSFKIVPNPNQGVFSVSIDFKKRTDIQLQIVNSIGQIILTRELSEQSQYIENIQLTNVASGIYFVKINAESKNQLRSMIIE